MTIKRWRQTPDNARADFILRGGHGVLSMPVYVCYFVSSLSKLTFYSLSLSLRSVPPDLDFTFYVTAFLFFPLSLFFRVLLSPCFSFPVFPPAALYISVSA